MGFIHLFNSFIVLACTNSTCRFWDFVALIALIALTRLQGYQGYRRGMLRYVSQSYKAIKATRKVCRERFLKATRPSRLLEGDTEKGLSRLQGYQGYWRGK